MSAVIDCHAMLGQENHLRLESAELLRRMEAAGVELAIARPMGSELAVENATGNARVLSAGERIRGWASVNPWFGGKALEEIKRASGMRAVGLYLDPNRQGFLPTDPVAAPAVEQALSLGWPVMVQTGAYINGDALALGELARRYPEGVFIAGSSGFSDMWFELPGLMRQVPNLYLDCSLIWATAVRRIVSEGHADRVLYGSAEPRSPYAASLAALGRLGLNDGDLGLILRENALRVLRLEQ